MGRRSRFSREPETTPIRALTHDGRGIADSDGKTVFVEGALPGETVQWTRKRRKRNYDEAVCDEVITASADRIAPGCDAFGRCGGCVMQHMSLELQLSTKQQVLSDNLERVGGVSPAAWLPPRMANAWGYRRRARLGVKYVDARERVLVGFRERYKPYITDMDHCPVLVEPVDRLIRPLADCIGELSIARRLPQIEVAVGDPLAPGEKAVTVLCLRVLDPPDADDLEKLASFSEAHDVWFYLQPGGPDSLSPLARRDGSVAPQLRYHLAEFDLALDFEPNDFVQVNGEMNERMVLDAVRLLDPQPGDRVLDLFCGIGNFTLPIARMASFVHGVEGAEALTERARANAARNGIDNVGFTAADLFEPASWEALMAQHWDRILLDPARAGAQHFAEIARKLGAHRIVYVSCNPGTLARDAKLLVETQGYQLLQAGVMNMFPHTAHVESIAVFDRVVD
ncbi:MAG: 23S rRNA (uracil(1939)-C(5))-methyltransferase RlmD [Pseudomonadota bacterium]